MPSDSASRHSSQKSPSQDGSAGRRKRESRAGTRSVSMLSPAQLERKRANDREAQRTIRQRNREHIEALERQVEELTGKKEQLDHALQQNVILEAEIDRLKQQLTSLNHQLRYSDAASFNPPPEHVSASSRAPTGPQDMMLNHQRSYSPMSQTSTGMGSEGQVDSSVAMPITPTWNPYMVTNVSSNCDEFASRGYDYFDASISECGLKEDSMPQALHGSLMHSHGRPQMVSNPPGMVYHEQMHHPHPHHPNQHRHHSQQPPSYEYSTWNDRSMLTTVSS